MTWIEGIERIPANKIDNFIFSISLFFYYIINISRLSHFFFFSLSSRLWGVWLKWMHHFILMFISIFFFSSFFFKETIIFFFFFQVSILCSLYISWFKSFTHYFLFLVHMRILIMGVQK